MFNWNGGKETFTDRAGRFVGKIEGTEKPDAGSLTMGDIVVLAYADRERQLDATKSVYHEVSQEHDLI